MSLIHDPTSPSKDNPHKKPVTYPTDRIFKNNKLFFEEATGFHSGPVSSGRSYRRALWSFAASIIDTLIVISLVCFFLVGFSMAVNANLNGIIMFFDGSFVVFGEIVFVLLAMSYTTLLRSFLGFTVGEWACDLRLGEPKERFSKFYSLKVILRTLVVFFTGIIVLPAVSLLTGYDMAGRISGIYLVQKN